MAADVLALRRPAPDLRRLRRLAAEHGLDGLILTTPAGVRHATGYSLWLESRAEGWMMARPGGQGRALASLVVVPLEGEPVLISTAVFAADAAAARARAQPYGALDLLAAPDGRAPLPELLAAALDRSAESPLAALARALDETGLGGARVGLEPDGLPPALLDRLRNGLDGTALPHCRWLPRLARMVKSDAEVELLAAASALSERVAREGFAAAADGVQPRELLQAYRAGVAAAGADLEHYSWSAGGAGLATDPEGPPPGPVACVDWGLSLHGYATDTGTTVVVGEPPDWVLEAQAVLHRCIEAGAGELAAGLRASAAARTMRTFLDQQGVTGGFPHGHGIGLELRDLPIVLPDAPAPLPDGCGQIDADVELEAGAVVNLEVTLFHRGGGAVEVERTFVVDHGGGRPLCDQPRDVPVMMGQ